MYKTHNLMVSDQAAANREIETLKEENSCRSLGKLLHECFVIHDCFKLFLFGKNI